MKLGTALKTFGGNLLEFGVKNSHTVMGVAAIGGLVATAVMAYKIRPKVDKIMDEQKQKMDELADNCDSEEEFDSYKRDITKETIKRLAPVAAPIVIVGVVTAGLMAGSVIESNHKISNLAGIATASDIAYKELYDKSRELLGDEKMNEVQKEIAEDKVKKEYEESPLEPDGMIQAKGGKQPFYDVMTGRVFKSDVDTIMHAIMACNHKITSGKEIYISLNEFYTELDLPQVVLGDDRGWGGFSLSNTLEPNLNNAIRLGDISVIVLDWYTRPTGNFK